MKKLRLEITELQVEPFDTGTHRDGRKGTVFARRTLAPDVTCWESCGGTCLWYLTCDEFCG
jgi:hypothetical protein